MGPYPYEGWDALKNPPVLHEDEAPLKLNVNRPVKMHGRDLLSSQDWSGQFFRYIGDAQPRLVREIHGKVRWWRIPYVIGRLRQDNTINQAHLTALLLVKREEATQEQVEATYACTQGQLDRLNRRITRQYEP